MIATALVTGATITDAMLQSEGHTSRQSAGNTDNNEKTRGYSAMPHDDVNSSFDLGPYTVRVMMRSDNPHWPIYLVSRDSRAIGRQFSRPCEDDCRALEREHRQGQMNEHPALNALPPAFRRGEGGFRNGRLTQHRRPGPGRPRKLLQPA